MFESGHRVPVLLDMVQRAQTLHRQRARNGPVIQFSWVFDNLARSLAATERNQVPRHSASWTDWLERNVVPCESPKGIRAHVVREVLVLWVRRVVFAPLVSTETQNSTGIPYPTKTLDFAETVTSTEGPYLTSETTIMDLSEANMGTKATGTVVEPKVAMRLNRLQRGFFRDPLWGWLLYGNLCTTHDRVAWLDEIYERVRPLASDPVRAMFPTDHRLVVFLTPGTDCVECILAALPWLRRTLVESRMNCLVSVFHVALRDPDAARSTLPAYLWRMVTPCMAEFLHHVRGSRPGALDELWDYAMHPVRLGRFLPVLLYTVGQDPTVAEYLSQVHRSHVENIRLCARGLYQTVVGQVGGRNHPGPQEWLRTYFRTVEDTPGSITLPLYLGDAEYNRVLNKLVVRDRPSFFWHTLVRDNASASWIFSFLAHHGYPARLVPHEFRSALERARLDTRSGL